MAIFMAQLRCPQETQTMLEIGLEILNGLLLLQVKEGIEKGFLYTGGFPKGSLPPTKAAAGISEP